MNRVEMLALFSALSKLCEKEEFESVTEVVEEVLREVRREDGKQ